jgi:WD40 repeat protein
VVPLPPGERLLVLVDQFEELFRYHARDSADAAAFVALLLGAVAHPDCHVVVTLRSEFLGACARFPDLPETINAGLFLTPRLRPAELADAIAKPPRLAELRGEVERDLVRALLEEAAYQQDRLPLLKHLLMRLWDRAEPDADGVRRLGMADLTALGGMQAALDAHAEQAFRELHPDPHWRPGRDLSPLQRTAEQLFRALTECTAGGEVERTLRGQSSSIADGTALAFLPDGRLVAGGYKGQVGIWDLESGKEQVLARVHTDYVNAVAVGSDGKPIATGGSDKTIILWDAGVRPLRRLRGHKNKILGLAFDPTGRHLLSASRDNRLRLWDSASGTTLRVYQGHETGLWSVLVRGGPGKALAYTAANDGSTLRRWPLDLPGQWVWDLEDREPTSNLVLPEDGLLLLGNRDGAIQGLPLPLEAASARDATALGTEAGSGTSSDEQTQSAPTPLFALPDAHGNQVLRFALSPDGETIATGSLDHTARLWHLESPGPDSENPSLTPLHRLTLHSKAVHAVAFSPDGRLLTTAGYDGQVGLFDVESGEGELTRAAESGRLANVEFSRDGDFLLSSHIEERRLRLWHRNGLQLTDGRTIARLADLPLWAALSSDGRRVAMVGRDQVVSIYPIDPETGNNAPNAPGRDPEADPTPLRLIGHESTVFRAHFTPEGRQLATVSSDMTLRLWDLDTAGPGPVDRPTSGPDATTHRNPLPDSSTDGASAQGSASAGGNRRPTGQPLFTLRLPTEFKYSSPLWDFDLRCTQDQTHCWLAVPLTIGRVALYRLPYAAPPPGLGRP